VSVFRCQGVKGKNQRTEGRELEYFELRIADFEFSTLCPMLYAQNRDKK